MQWTIICSRWVRVCYQFDWWKMVCSYWSLAISNTKMKDERWTVLIDNVGLAGHMVERCWQFSIAEMHWDRFLSFSIQSITSPNRKSNFGAMNSSMFYCNYIKAASGPCCCLYHFVWVGPCFGYPNQSWWDINPALIILGKFPWWAMVPNEQMDKWQWSKMNKDELWNRLLRSENCCDFMFCTLNRLQSLGKFLVHWALAVVYSYKWDMIRRTSMNLII